MTPLSSSDRERGTRITPQKCVFKGLSVSAAKKELIRTIEYVEKHVLYVTPEPSRAESLQTLDAAVIAFNAIRTKCPNREIQRFVTKSIGICHGLANFIRLPRRDQKRLNEPRRRGMSYTQAVNA